MVLVDSIQANLPNYDVGLVGLKGADPAKAMAERSNIYIFIYVNMVVNPKIGGKPPKMDGENNGTPY